MPALKPRIRDDLTVVELDGEIVIYDERADDIHHLNPTASVVFSLCDGRSTVREMAIEIAGAFGAPEDQVEREIRPLLREFRKAGLLVERGARVG
ncbi:MAG: PqqD family protein [Actinomycetota bacterium]